MQNVCKYTFLILTLLLTSASVIHADSSVTSLEQLEEKMENVTFCSDTRNDACNNFNCLEVCLNLTEDPVDCTDMCYLQVKHSVKSTSQVALRY